MLTEKEITEVEKIATQNKSVKKILEEYLAFCYTPYYDTYETIYGQIKDWNMQLKIHKNELGSVTGRIDIFADKDTKEFDRAFKFFDKATELHASLDVIRDKMTPKEKEDLEKKGKIKGDSVPLVYKAKV